MDNMRLGKTNLEVNKNGFGALPIQRRDERDSIEETDRIFKEGDIYKMHTYKDSILTTEGAYVLYPGNKTKQFFESNTIIPSVGAFSLTPGNDEIEENNLEMFIKKVLKTLLFYQGLVTLDFESENYQHL